MVAGDHEWNRGISLARITKRVVDGLQPGELVWDTELKGFAARRRSDGVTYLVKYRVGGGRSGRQRWFMIGRHGAPWTPDTARKEANGILLQVRHGDDPAGEREKDRQAETVGELWQTFRTRHAVPSKKARSLEEDDRLARIHILPAFEHRKVNEITRADIARWHASKADTPFRANRTLALLRTMLSKAEEWGIRAEGTNPATRISKFPEPPRERFLTETEMSKLGQTLYDFEARNAAPPHAIALLRLLCFTGMRLSEGMLLRWDWVDLPRRAIRLPDSKTGAKTVPLSTPAIDVLQSVLRIEGEGYVFPGRTPGKPIQGIQKIWQRIRVKAGLPDIRIHDLRHAFASVAVQSGESLYLVGKILGHRQASTTERYAHLTADPVQSVAENTANTIAAAFHRRAASSALLPPPSA